MTHTELLELAAKATQGALEQGSATELYVDKRHQVCCGRGRYECCGEPDIAGDMVLVARFDSEANTEVFAAAADFVRSPEFAALVKDAERYRWMRDNGGERWKLELEAPNLDLDAAIDAELK